MVKAESSKAAEVMKKPIFEPMAYQNLYSDLKYSTDVGDVSWNCPVAQIGVATMPAGTPMHSWQTVAVGKSPMAHKGMLYAAKVMAASAIDAIEDPDIIRRAKEEFEWRTGGRNYDPPIPLEVRPRV